MVNPYAARPRGTDQARVIQVIETKALVGIGLDKKDPCRIVTQYWDFEGNLLAVSDIGTTDKEIKNANDTKNLL